MRKPSAKAVMTGWHSWDPAAAMAAVIESKLPPAEQHELLKDMTK